MISFATLNASIAPSSAALRKPLIFPRSKPSSTKSMSASSKVTRQYQVSTDKRSGITNDPNREDDPQYILRLIGQVITVSLEAVRIVRSLPPLGLPPEEKSSTSPAVNLN